MMCVGTEQAFSSMTKYCVGGLLGKYEEAALFSVLDALRAFCACNRIDTPVQEKMQDAYAQV